MSIEQGKQKIERAKRNMPVMALISQDFASRMPFKGIVIGCCLHITSETALLCLALKSGGASVLLTASNPLSTNDDVVEALREQGIVVYGKRGETVEEYNANLLRVAHNLPDIIIDDGADLSRAVHNLSPELKMPIGGCEETTTGVNVIRQMEKRGELRYPILNVNDAVMKHNFDNYYGTGQSVIDGIMRATNKLLAGQTFVIAGYGYCGRGLAQRARGMGCNVIITEIDPIQALKAIMDGFQVMTMFEAATIGDIFVTVTGNRDVITTEHMKLMKDRAILANAGHFDVEINVNDVKEFPNLILLGEGRLVNLVCAEGHPSSVMDMSFSLQALGCEYMLDNAKDMTPRVHDMPKEIDDMVAKLKLESLGIKIDELTQEQKKYLGYV
jgi:adenosylhomocysteinase